MSSLAFKTWFSGLSRQDKATALLVVMHEMTIMVRSIGHYFPNDCEARWRLAYHLSEVNHVLTSAAWAFMRDDPTYSDEALIDIMLDHSAHPELNREFASALDKAVEALAPRGSG